jgi:enoyl-CoA hydratase
MDSHVTDLQFETITGTAWAILDRPKALNALSRSMIDGLAAWLSKSLADNNIFCLGIRSAHPTAFSAGGDVRALYAAHQGGDRALLHSFYWHEYRLNRAIRHCRKPYIAMIDGLVMGGGAGVSINGSHRIAGPNARFAMPETGIGFFPDAGASWFLSRCPGQLGVYLGLTGEVIGPADMLHAGIATHYLPAAIHLTRYSEIAGLPVEAGEAPLAARQGAIDRCFAGDSVETILLALEAENSDWARECARKLHHRAPLALKVTLRQLRIAATLSFDETMVMEYRLARHFMAGHDFFEGVRAAVIDKDRKPRWNPASLEEASDGLVESYFMAADGPDLEFD